MMSSIIQKIRYTIFLSLLLSLPLYPAHLLDIEQKEGDNMTASSQEAYHPSPLSAFQNPNAHDKKGVLNFKEENLVKKIDDLQGDLDDDILCVMERLEQGRNSFLLGAILKSKAGAYYECLFLNQGQMNEKVAVQKATRRGFYLVESKSPHYILTLLECLHLEKNYTVEALCASLPLCQYCYHFALHFFKAKLKTDNTGCCSANFPSLENMPCSALAYIESHLTLPLLKELIIPMMGYVNDSELQSSKDQIAILRKTLQEKEEKIRAQSTEIKEVVKQLKAIHQETIIELLSQLKEKNEEIANLLEPPLEEEDRYFSKGYVEKVIDPMWDHINLMKKDAFSIMLMGDTGCGKSTCINYLLGHGMIKVMKNIHNTSMSYNSEDSDNEPSPDYSTFLYEVDKKNLVDGVNVASIGHTISPGILYPSFFLQKTHQVVLCDLPDFLDKRGIGEIKEKVYTAIAFKVSLKVVSAASFLCLINRCSLEADLFHTMKVIMKMFPYPVKHVESIFFGLTKARGWSAANFRNRIIAYRNCLKQEIKTKEGGTSFANPKVSLVYFLLTKLLKEHKNHFFILNIDKPEERDDILSLLKKCPKVDKKEIKNIVTDPLVHKGIRGLYYKVSKEAEELLQKNEHYTKEIKKIEKSIQTVRETKLDIKREDMGELEYEELLRLEKKTLKERGKKLAKKLSMVKKDLQHLHERFEEKEKLFKTIVATHDCFPYTKDITQPFVKAYQKQQEENILPAIFSQQPCLEQGQEEKKEE